MKMNTRENKKEKTEGKEEAGESRHVQKKRNNNRIEEIAKNYFYSRRKSIYKLNVLRSSNRSTLVKQLSIGVFFFTHYYGFWAI